MRLDRFPLPNPICAIVHLDTQPLNVLQQVTLRPDKRIADFIRLGETPGDEALCWIAIECVDVIHVLGTAISEIDANGTEQWKVVPEMEKAA